MNPALSHLALAVAPGTDMIQTALRSIRTHLGLEVAYVSEFVGDQALYRRVDAPGWEHLIKAGDVRPLAEVFCPDILAGRLPELMGDVAAVPEAMRLPLGRSGRVGAHISVPVTLADGRHYGMFCCLSPAAHPDLNQRDLQLLRVFADLVARQIDIQSAAGAAVAAAKVRIEERIARRDFELVFQPIYGLDRMEPLGFEVLSRFPMAPHRPPDAWFNEAEAVGLAPAMDAAVIERALIHLDALAPPAFLSINMSPATILSGELDRLLAGRPGNRIVIELTEHAPITDYALARAAMAPLRRQGVRLAIDDVGAGYASLRHVLALQPDTIKLDMTLTRSIDTDPARKALASSISAFAREMGYTLVAEGIETEAELATLLQLGIERGQGYLLGRPASLDAAVQLTRSGRRQ